MYVYYYTSPIGILKIESNQQKIIKIIFSEIKSNNPKNLPAVLKQCIQELDKYFEGSLQEFSVPIAFHEGTHFQQGVWQALLSVPYAKTASYKDIAISINNEKACRAVGGANNKNPIVIIVPCHRIIGANKKLVGYGGGLDKKEWLLQHEASYKKA